MSAPGLVFLVEVDAWSYAAGAPVTWYFATEGYQAPAAEGFRPYRKAVGRAADVRVTLPDDGAAARTEAGQIVLENVPVPGAGGGRPLSDLVTAHALAGWEVRVRAGRAGGPMPVVLRAVQDVPEVTRRAVMLNLVPWESVLDRPALAETYTGTGAEGDPADLRGRVRERCFGWCRNIAPVYVGTAASGRHLFSVNGGRPIEGVVAVYDRGRALTEVGGTPAAGQWRQDRATGRIELGGAYAGQITADVRGDKRGGLYRSSAPALMAELAAEVSGAVPWSAVDPVALAAALAEAPAEVGLWIDGSGSAPTVRQVLEELAAGWRGWHHFDALGLWRLGRHRAPAGVPVRTYRRHVDTPGLEPAGVVASSGRGVSAYSRGVPASEVTVRHSRSWLVQSGDSLAELAPEAVRLFVGQDYRAAPPVPSADLAAYPTAAPVILDTLLTTEADAAALAAEAADVLRVPRRQWRLPLVDPALADGVRIGDVVRVVDDVPGYTAGRLVTVAGFGIDDRRGGYSFTVRE